MNYFYFVYFRNEAAEQIESLDRGSKGRKTSAFLGVSISLQEETINETFLYFLSGLIQLKMIGHLPNTMNLISVF